MKPSAYTDKVEKGGLYNSSSTVSTENGSHIDPTSFNFAGTGKMRMRV